MVDPDIEGGPFWGPRFAREGCAALASPPRITVSEEIATRLWAVCEEATGVSWPRAERARRR